jgi:hypothetical protein
MADTGGRRVDDSPAAVDQREERVVLLHAAALRAEPQTLIKTTPAVEDAVSQRKICPLTDPAEVCSLEPVWRAFLEHDSARTAENSPSRCGRCGVVERENSAADRGDARIGEFDEQRR